MRESVRLIKVLLVLVLLILATAPVLPDQTPEGASNIEIINSSRRDLTPAKTVGAQAGNVTELDITGIAVTQTWQGYYGNVSGTITLDNANNFTLYDWDLASPKGEIYASNETIDWGSISCFNYSATGTGGGGELNLSEYETWLGVESDDVDGVDETFGTPNHPLFYVGTTTIQANKCNTTHTYVNDTSQSTYFKEVLLYDSNNNNVVFTALIENNTIGFDEQSHDFQMLVGENGHNGDTQVTTYYFYVELE